jgi:hypothetical protein
VRSIVAQRQHWLARREQVATFARMEWTGNGVSMSTRKRFIAWRNDDGAARYVRTHDAPPFQLPVTV